jgi:DNA-formamidopyrimidine glycosylase
MDIPYNVTTQKNYLSHKMIVLNLYMPEGPEVKVIMDNILAMIKGKVLTAVEINDNFLKRTKDMNQLMLPQVVQEVNCKGKFGYIILADQTAIGIGYGMTGNVRIDPSEEYLKSRGETLEKYMKHCKVKFKYENTDGTGADCFYYNTTRNFGTINFHTSVELGKKLSKLGPCILSPSVLDKEQLLIRWRKSSGKNICTMLLDQAQISGIGNYIKAEILYTCKVDPNSTVKELSDDTLYDLYLAAKHLATDAYTAGGTSLYTYTGLHGDKTTFKFQLQVYNRQFDPLGNKVVSLKTPDKRTTHWVPEIQGKSAAAVPVVIKKIKAKIKIQVLSA